MLVIQEVEPLKGAQMGTQAKSSDRYTEAQMKYFLEAAQAEQEFEMSAAFGSGVKVVNVLTGKVTVTK